MTRTYCLASILLCLIFALLLNEFLAENYPDVLRRVKGQKTISDVLELVGPDAESRLVARFEAAGLKYPPDSVTLVAFKDSKVMSLYADNHKVSDFEIHGMSGDPGPKLKEGDGQVPEGVYALESLNPNSSFHLSLKLNFPNPYDLAKAEADQRNDIGSNIMIHGGSASVGCLAMGDEAIEELFVLAVVTGSPHVRVIISPTDLRLKRPPVVESVLWSDELYAGIRLELAKLTEGVRADL